MATNSEFGFGLRATHGKISPRRSTRAFFAIVDEVDNILIDRRARR